MAVGQGMIATQPELLQDSMVIDMREEISMADQDESQFTTLKMKAGSGECTREKINWREKDYFPRLVTLLTAYTAVTTPTAVVLAAGHGVNVRKGDVLRNMTSGECLYVTSVTTDTATCIRQVGAKAAAAGTGGDIFLIASNASPQGADYPDTAVQISTVQSNYTQIFRHGSSFSRTARAVNYYGRSEPDQESALKGIEHKRAIEYSGFWGARDQKTDTNTNEPVGFAGGLVEYVTSNKWDVAGQITMDNLDSNLRNYLQRASKNTIWFVSPIIAQNLSKLNRAGQGTTWKPEPQSTLGVKVDAYLSGVYGYEIGVIVKKDWNDFTTASKGYGGWSFLVDMDRITFRTLTGAGTRLLTNRQHPGADRVSEEWLTEATWEIRNQQSHSIIYGVV